MKCEVERPTGFGPGTTAGTAGRAAVSARAVAEAAAKSYKGLAPGSAKAAKGQGDTQASNQKKGPAWRMMLSKEEGDLQEPPKTM